MKTPVYVIERLTFRAWILLILPHIFRHRFQRGSVGSQIYVIDASAVSFLIAKAFGYALRSSVHRLDFRLAQLVDQNGWCVRIKIEVIDLPKIHEYAKQEPAYQNALQKEQLVGNLSIFVQKGLTVGSAFDKRNLLRPCVLLNLCLIKKSEWVADGSIELFLERRPWIGSFVRYASEHDVRVRLLPVTVQFKQAFRRRTPGIIIELTRAFLDLRHGRVRSWFNGLKSLSSFAPRNANSNVIQSSLESSGADSSPKIAVESFNQLNLDYPDRQTDLFYWQMSDLLGSDLIVTFHTRLAPFTRKKSQELQNHGMEAVVLYPGSLPAPGATRFTQRSSHTISSLPKVPIFGGDSGKWLRTQITEYHRLFKYWSEFFSTYNAPVFVTFNHLEATYVALNDALRAYGGVSVTYQRSYETHSSDLMATNADLYFGFSSLSANLHRSSGSTIDYFVVTGYLGDHRVTPLKEKSKRIRTKLLNSGASRILAFFDEGTGDDWRYINGHHFTQENYEFLLRRVLDEPWLGLVIKPKTPRTIRRRLGPISELLEKAESTGRCILLEDGIDESNLGWNSPTTAALAADVAIHGHLIGGTAGIEAALAGVPTIFLDRERWPDSPLYDLGLGQSVFLEWDHLWDACLEHWSTPDRNPGFGDWSPLLDELDPYRDGRAAERMGSYLKWIIEGFKSGMDRDSAMAYAAEEFSAIWGIDKVIRIKDIPPASSLLDSRQHRTSMIPDSQRPGAARVQTP